MKVSVVDKYNLIKVKKFKEEAEEEKDLRGGKIKEKEHSLLKVT